MPFIDLRTPAGELPTWGETIRILEDEARLDAIGPAQRAVLQARGIIDVALNGEPYSLPVLLSGVVLRHDLTAAEIAGDHLELDPDLSILAVPVKGGLRASTGESLVLVDHQHLEPARAKRPTQAGRRLLMGPPGWLNTFAVGEQVAIGLIDATLVIGPSASGPGGEPHTSTANPQPLASPMLEIAGPCWGRLRAMGVAPSLPLAGLVLGAMAADRDLFTDVPIPPLAQVLSAAGMPHALGFVGPPGTERVILQPNVFGNPANQLLPATLGDEEMAAMLQLGEVIGRLDLEIEQRPVLDSRSRSLMMKALRDWRTVELLADTASAGRGTRLMVEHLLPGSPRAIRAPLHHLRSVHHLRAGAFAHALSDSAAALKTADVNLVREWAARLLVVAGDRVGLIALRAGSAGNQEVMRAIDALVPMAEADPADRARSLMRRVQVYLATAGCGDLAAHQAHALLRRGLRPDHLTEEMLSDDLLFHGSGLRRFAQEVGPLLSDREQGLITQWLASRRRWWRVVRDESIGARLRALGDGEEVWARWPSPGTDLGGAAADGELLLARVLPVDDERWIAPCAILAGQDDPDDLPDPDDIIGVVIWASR